MRGIQTGTPWTVALFATIHRRRLEFAEPCYMERGAAHLARACAKRSKSALSPYIAGLSGRFKYLDFCERQRS